MQYPFNNYEMKGLTPEEKRIIRETMAHGEQKQPSKQEIIKSALTFSAIFILFVFIAYLIFR